MDDQAVGIRLRAARVRHGWRQSDLGRRARVSDGTISRLERGHVDGMTVGSIRRVAAALDIRVTLQIRARGGDLERLANAGHVALANAVILRIRALPGWVVRPEVSFSRYGERGVVDLLAWHAASRSLLVIELKTSIVDVGELLGTLDRKRRLGAAIAAPFGWAPATTSTWLIVSESSTSWRRMAAVRATFDAVLPDDGRAARAWLLAPKDELNARSMWSDRHQGSIRSAAAGRGSARRRGSRAS